MKLMMVQADKLKPLEGNPRRVKDPQAIEKLKTLIAAHGFQNPLQVWRDESGELVILAGNHRYAAGCEMGMKEFACVEYEATRDMALARAISDNKSGEWTEWELDGLREMMEGIDDVEMTGFTAEELGELFGSVSDGGTDGLTDPDDVPDPPAEPITKPGDIWQLGRHRLMCGDSTSIDAVEKLMGGRKADAVLTDPPYGQNQPGVPGDAPEIHSRLMRDVINLLPITDGVVVAFQSPRTFHAWTDAAREAGFTFERMLWMYKAAQCTFPWRGWILTSESIPVCSVGTPSWQEVHPFSHDCYYLPEVSGELPKELGWHGSVKPIAVVSDIVARICPIDAKVLDPFLGSGTTLIACEKTGRTCYGMEISPHYCDVIVKRWEDFTGQKAVLL